METHDLTAALSVFLYAVVDVGAIDTIKALPCASEICVVRLGDLACVTSAASDATLTEPVPSDAEDQLRWVTPLALRHHSILQQLIEATDVVPLKFGTVCSRPEDVSSVLRDHYGEFSSMLCRFRCRKEWAVRVYVDRPAALRHISHSEPALLAIDRQLPRSEGETYLLRKKKQKLTNEFFFELIHDMEARIFDRMKCCVSEFMRTDAPKDEVGQDRVCASAAAALVSAEEFRILEQELAAIERDFSALQAAAEVTGPWPPYSFV